MRWAAIVLAGCAVARPPAGVLRAPPRMRVAAVGSIATSASPPSAPVPDDPEAAIAALAAGDFATVVAAFAEASAPSVAEVETAWHAHTRNLGAVRSWQRTDRTFQDGLEVVSVRLELERGALQCLVAYEPESRQLRSLFFAPPAPPAAYVDASKFRELGVIVGSPPYELGGTLLVPRGAGPFPIAVLVHGSGPNDRDASVGALKPFKDIAEGLASKGIAVLRYDKRTYAYRDRLSNSVTLDDEVVVDALAAVQACAARADIDPSRVVVIGHSLGGMLAPEIAVRSGVVTGIALLAPPARPPWEIVREQMRYLGAPRETLAMVERAAVELAIGDDDGSLVGMPYSYWRDWASRDGVAMARRFARPTLVLRGTRDYQVSAADYALWERGLRGERYAKFVTIADLDHAMVAGRGRPTPIEYYVPAHVDARVIATLASWITSSNVARSSSATSRQRGAR